MTTDLLKNQTTVNAQDNTPSIMDRNILYNYDKIEYKEDSTLGAQFILFAQYLAQKQLSYRLFNDDYLMFTASEIASFTGKTKSDILKKVPNWSHKVRISEHEEIEVSSRLDKLLHYYAHHPIKAEEIYKFKADYNDSFKDHMDYIFASGKAPTFLDDYIYSVKNNKSRERIYGIKINSFCLNSIISESTTFYPADAPLLNGKGIDPKVYFKLLKERNKAISEQRNQFTIPFHHLVVLAEINTDKLKLKYSHAKTISRVKTRLNSILDKFIKGSEFLSLKYDFNNTTNQYVFTILKTNQSLLPAKYKLATLTKNTVRRCFLDFFNQHQLISTENLTNELKEILVRKLIDTFDFNKRDPEYTEIFINSIAEVTTQLDKQLLRIALEKNTVPARKKYHEARNRINAKK